jgi:hypothetical protein
MASSPSMSPFTRLPDDAQQRGHQSGGTVDNWSQQQPSSPKPVTPWPIAANSPQSYGRKPSPVRSSGGSIQAPILDTPQGYAYMSPNRIASPYVSPGRTGSPYISPARSATSSRNLSTSQTLGDNRIVDELEFTHNELSRVMAGNAEVTGVAHRALEEKNLAMSMLAKVTAEKHELEPAQANFAIEKKLNKKLQGMIEELEQQQAALNKENASLKDQLTLTRELNSELMLGLDEAKGTNASQFKGLNLAKADFEARVGALSLRLETALLDRKQLKQKIEAMEKEAEPRKKVAREAEFEVVSMLEDKARLSALVVDLEKRLVAKSENLIAAEAERDDALLAANEVQTDLRAFKREGEDLEALLKKVILDRDIYFARSEQAERELKDWRRKESSYQDQTVERNSLRKSLTIAEESVKELEIKLSELQERSVTDLNAATRRAECAEEELKWLKEEAKQVMSDKLRLKIALEELEKTFENSKKVETALRNEVNALNAANSQLRSSLATTVNERDGLGAKVLMLDGLMTKKSATSRAVVHRIVLRWKNARLSAALDGWRSHFEHNRNILAKIVYRWSHQTISHAMGSWKEAIMEMSRQRKIIGRLLFRWQNKCLVSAINCWAMQVERQRELANKTRRVLYRWVNQRIVSGFNHWVERTEASKELKNKVGAVLFRWNHMDVATAFNSWSHNVDEHKWNRAIIGRVVDRWIQRTLLTAFNTWSDSASQHKRQVYVVNKVIMRWTSMTMLRAFNAWLEAMTEEGRLQANGMAMTAVLNLWQKRSSQATLAMTAWKIVCKRNHVLSHSFNRLTSRFIRYLVFRIFSGWFVLCQESKVRARNVASRWQRLLIGATLSSIQGQMSDLGEEFRTQPDDDTPPATSPTAGAGRSPMSAAISDPRNKGKILSMMGSSGRDIVVKIPTKIPR